MDELLKEYVVKFNENFPTFLFRTKEDSETMAAIQKCIDDGKPYETELDDEANY